MPIRAIALVVACLMLVNDIAWAEPASIFKSKENPFTLAAESRLNPFFKEHGLDFKNAYLVMCAAGHIRDRILADDLRGSHIEKLNRRFADGSVRIDEDIRKAYLKTGKSYHIAVFNFNEEKKSFSAYIVKDPEGLTDEELEELHVADVKDRPFFLSPDYPGLKGVWFVDRNADTGMKAMRKDDAAVKGVNELLWDWNFRIYALEHKRKALEAEGRGTGNVVNSLRAVARHIREAMPELRAVLSERSIAKIENALTHLGKEKTVVRRTGREVSVPVPNEPVANMDIVSIIVTEMKEMKKALMERRSGEELKAERVFYRDGFWHVRERSFRRDAKWKTSVLRYGYRRYDTLWEAFRALDHQIDSEIEERAYLGDFVSLIGRLRASGAADREELEGAVDRMLLRLARVKIEEKRLARIVLTAAKTLLKHDRMRQAAGLLNIVEEQFVKRLEEIESIALGLSTSRLKTLRKEADAKNGYLMEKASKIMANLDAGHYKLTAKIIDEDLLAGHGARYMKEPDFAPLVESLGFISERFKRGPPAPKDIDSLKRFFRLFHRRVVDSLAVASFMQTYRDEFMATYRPAGCDIEAARNAVFDAVSARYLAEDKNASKDPEVYAKLFRQAAFMAPRVYKGEGKVSNPEFDAVTAEALRREAEEAGVRPEGIELMLKGCQGKTGGGSSNQKPEPPGAGEEGFAGPSTQLGMVRGMVSPSNHSRVRGFASSTGLTHELTNSRTREPDASPAILRKPGASDGTSRDPLRNGLRGGETAARKTIAYCGLYCGACYHYRAMFKYGDRVLAEARKAGKDMDGYTCQGCGAERSCIYKLCQDCVIRTCAKEKGLFHCGQCKEFPCPRMAKFIAEPNHIHHRDVAPNMRELDELGPEEWLARHGKKWSCPACGEPFSWYDEFCPNCGNAVQSYNDGTRDLIGQPMIPEELASRKGVSSGNVPKTDETSAESAVRPRRGEEIRAKMEELFQKGYDHCVAEDYTTAVAYFTIVLKIDPKCAPAHFNMGYLRQALGDEQSAVRHWAEAVYLDKSLFRSVPREFWAPVHRAVEKHRKYAASRPAGNDMAWRVLEYAGYAALVVGAIWYVGYMIDLSLISHGTSLGEQIERLTLFIMSLFGGVTAATETPGRSGKTSAAQSAESEAGKSAPGFARKGVPSGNVPEIVLSVRRRAKNYSLKMISRVLGSTLVAVMAVHAAWLSWAARDLSQNVKDMLMGRKISKSLPILSPDLMFSWRAMPEGLRAQVAQIHGATARLLIYGPEGKEPVNAGSGVAISPDGKIVTAYHVIRGVLSGSGGRVVVELPAKPGEPYSPARRYAMAGVELAREESDIAVIKVVSPAAIPYIPLAGYAPLLPGDRISIASYRQGAPISHISLGKLTENEASDDIRVIRYDADVRHGSSGAGIFQIFTDGTVRLVGVATQGLGIPYEMLDPGDVEPGQEHKMVGGIGVRLDRVSMDLFELEEDMRKLQRDVGAAQEAGEEFSGSRVLGFVPRPVPTASLRNTQSAGRRTMNGLSVAVLTDKGAITPAGYFALAYNAATFFIGAIVISKLSGAILKGLAKLATLDWPSMHDRAIHVFVSGADKGAALHDLVSITCILRPYWYFKGYDIQVIPNAKVRDLKLALMDPAVQNIAVMGHGDWGSWQATDGVMTESDIEDCMNFAQPKKSFLTYTCGHKTDAGPKEAADKFGAAAVAAPEDGLRGTGAASTTSWWYDRPGLFRLSEMKGAISRVMESESYAKLNRALLVVTCFAFPFLIYGAIDAAAIFLYTLFGSRFQQMPAVEDYFMRASGAAILLLAAVKAALYSAPVISELLMGRREAAERAAGEEEEPDPAKEAARRERNRAELAVLSELRGDPAVDAARIDDIERCGYVSFEVSRRLLRQAIDEGRSPGEIRHRWQDTVAALEKVNLHRAELADLLSVTGYPSRMAAIALMSVAVRNGLSGLAADDERAMRYVAGMDERMPWLSDFLPLIGLDVATARGEATRDNATGVVRLKLEMQPDRKKVFETLFNTNIPDDMLSYELVIKNGRPFCLIWDGFKQYADRHRVPCLFAAPLGIMSTYKGFMEAVLEACPDKARKEFGAGEAFIADYYNDMHMLSWPGTWNSGGPAKDGADRVLSEHAKEGALCLDVGCGGGCVSLGWAGRGGRAVTTDMNPLAVAATRYNSIALGLDDRIEVVGPGDLFEAVKGRKFPYIIFVPPVNPQDIGQTYTFHSGAGYNETNKADYHGTLDRFAYRVADYLEDGGKCFVVHSHSYKLMSRFEQPGIVVDGSETYYLTLQHDPDAEKDPVPFISRYMDKVHVGRSGAVGESVVDARLEPVKKGLALNGIKEPLFGVSLDDGIDPKYATGLSTGRASITFFEVRPSKSLMFSGRAFIFGVLDTDDTLIGYGIIGDYYSESEDAHFSLRIFPQYLKDRHVKEAVLMLVKGCATRQIFRDWKTRLAYMREAPGRPAPDDDPVVPLLREVGFDGELSYDVNERSKPAGPSAEPQDGLAFRPSPEAQDGRASQGEVQTKRNAQAKPEAPGSSGRSTGTPEHPVPPVPEAALNPSPYGQGSELDDSGQKRRFGPGFGDRLPEIERINPALHRFLSRFFDPSNNKGMLAYDVYSNEDESGAIPGSADMRKISGYHNLAVIAHGLGCKLVHKNVLGRDGKELTTPPWALPMEEDRIGRIAVPGSYEEAFGDFYSSLRNLIWFHSDRFYRCVTKFEQLPLFLVPVTESPLDTISAIFGPTRALEMLYTDEREARRIMDIAVETSIGFVKAVRGAFPGICTAAYYATWMPDRVGMSIGEDSMTLISPEMYERLIIPRLDAIGEAFGGYFLHACGDITKYIAALGRSKWLRGITFMAWTTPPEAIIAAFSGRFPIVPYIGCLDRNFIGPEKEDPTIHLIRRSLAAMQPDTKLLLEVNPFTELTEVPQGDRSGFLTMHRTEPEEILALVRDGDYRRDVAEDGFTSSRVHEFAGSRGGQVGATNDERDTQHAERRAGMQLSAGEKPEAPGVADGRDTKTAILELMKSEADFESVTAMLLECAASGGVSLMIELVNAIKKDGNYELYLESLHTSIYAHDSFVEVVAGAPADENIRELLESRVAEILNALDSLFTDCSADELPGAVAELQALLLKEKSPAAAPESVSEASPSGGWRQEEVDLSDGKPETGEAFSSSRVRELAGLREEQIDATNEGLSIQNAERRTQNEIEADNIHAANLKLTPDIAAKTLVCHIIADSIVPAGQQRMLKTVAEELRKDKYPEKVISLSVNESDSADEFMRKLETAKGERWIKEYLDKGYTITFDVACPRQDLVQKVQAAGMQALAFNKEGDGDIVQVEGIIMALRALGTGKMDELLKAFKLLSGKDATVSAQDIMELAQKLTFILPLRKIDTNRIGALNSIIEKNILSAA